ncbi:hypothetical protein L2E82_32770 [Cichorium intybus]|uniref:Uncharacterized protein n=1 Tax=Cichorium intybus TaxID=13427 RepID=A0ACB9BI32_CICIN|nr:hypothetical protein L2E82_32770 [Cichorium intybus]
MENQINSVVYHQENIIRTRAESTWTTYEDKLFERALVNVPENSAGRWQEIAKAVPGKTAEQVKAHYHELLHDLDKIESGQIELPRYADDYDGNESSVRWNSKELRRSEISFGAGKGSKHGEGERKKGTPWTQEEHRRFLKGLKEYGKGDWRSISRNCVITRTPTQVASHAQKYFLRQSSLRKERKRASIHDITTTDTTMMVQPPPPTNIYSCGGAPPQIGYEYQEAFGYPN